MEKNHPASPSTPMATDRFYISALGEYYSDLLKVEAFIKNRTMSNEGNSLLCSKLMERESKRNEMVSYLARKRGISEAQMVQDIITDTAKPLSADEYKELIAAAETKPAVQE